MITSMLTPFLPCAVLPYLIAGMAVIADGYVQVISCSKKTPYKEGKMQAVVDYRTYDNNYRGPESERDHGDAKPIKPSPDQFIAKPYTMDFILRKTGDY
jgi:hypothetical protein